MFLMIAPAENHLDKIGSPCSIAVDIRKSIIQDTEDENRQAQCACAGGLGSPVVS